MGESDHCCLFNGVATKDIIVASNNDVNFVETQTVHFVWLNRSLFRFEIINKVDLDFSQRQILSFVCPLKYHLIFAFIPSILKRVQRWWVSWIRSINSLLCQKGRCINLFSEDAPCGLMLDYWTLRFTASLPGRVQSVPNYLRLE